MGCQGELARASSEALVDSLLPEQTAVADYARAEGVPISVVESGCPMSNFASSMGPKRVSSTFSRNCRRRS